MTKYAYILQGEVMYIEDRDVDISKLVAPDLTDRFIPIPEGQTVRVGQIYSDGAFIDNPLQPPDVLVKYQNLLLERDQMYKAAVKLLIATATTMTDAQALSIPTDFYPTWPEEGLNDNGQYVKGQVIKYGSGLYRIAQPVAPQAHQPPDGEGMLAVYRPVSPSHAGTLEDPIPWVYGMDCTTGTYYSYNGTVYRCAGDMIPCVWYPDSGIWQWEAVNG